MDYNELLAKAKEGLKFSYSPYSKLRVAAALLSKSGKVYVGCNIENSGFTATICAERTALAKAVSEGEREFSAIAVVSDMDGITPCGVCLQSLFEFSRDIDIIIEKHGKPDIKKINEYLPYAFCGY